MAFGGFFGNDPILSVDAFAEKVERGEVRYVLLAHHAPAARLQRWVQANGTPVDPAQWRSLPAGAAALDHALRPGAALIRRLPRLASSDRAPSPFSPARRLRRFSHHIRKPVTANTGMMMPETKTRNL